MTPARASASMNRGYRAMMLPASIAVGIFAIAPLAGMFALSLTNYNLIRGWNGEIGIANFLRLLDDHRFIASVYIMAALSGFGVLAQVVLGTAVAVGLDKIVSRWKAARGIFVIPFAVPHVAVALIWLSLFTPTLSPINAFFDIFGITVPAMLTTQSGAIAAIVIADTWATYPFVMLIVLAALQGISPDLDEAAALDGASRVKTFFLITLPLLYPTLLMVALFRFIETLKHFPLIFVMTNGGPGRATQATNYYAYVQTFQNSNVGYGASIAVVLFVFAAIVSFYIARFNARYSNA
ncbi:MAG: ABC transporter permease [Martelella sp.]|uniref:carbohydrate ABC transporter permease n=1 Tax=unclassified Martelella TaxID=2629616 RepID=UPI000C3623F5|nr:sugar ABC transporter permease [Martelella sp.]MAU22923.1 ABC transporter permease [Martelella sp.]|tara:strand:- start:2660 stop:3544 length:885 start_codon:yes stop_codon:yes gene_type:complete